MITIVDYGLGNVASIANMLKRIGAEAVIEKSPDRVRSASKLIIPGVGAFDSGMELIESSGLRDVIDEKIKRDRVPTLGICLGMQLLALGSEEGQRSGLGYIKARFHRFPSEIQGHRLRVPHMGWNRVFVTTPNALTSSIRPDSRFYFVHSYYARCESSADILLTSHHGLEFPAAFGAGNVWGVQFHPEKSHKFGMELLAGFAAISG